MFTKLKAPGTQSADSRAHSVPTEPVCKGTWRLWCTSIPQLPRGPL